VSPYYEQHRDAPVNYEDLFYLTDQLLSTILNPAIQPFVEQMRAACGDLCWQARLSQERIDFDELCSKACDFIQCVVRSQLRREASPRGMDLILDLARQASAGSGIERLAICTLNHDVLVEKLLDGIQCETGFDRPEDGGFFDPSRFRQFSSRIRFFKLHGSINWYRYQRREGEHHSDHYVKRTPGWKHPENENGVIWIANDIPRILTGSYNKLEAYGTDIIKEFMHAFHSELAEHNLIVMSGYGWGDYAINQRLCEWLGRSPSHRIVLLHQDDPISMFRVNHIIWNQCDRLVNLRKLVLIPKWLQHTTWPEIANRIAL